MKIISGGQTGADQGALVGAKQIGLETGGWMPRFFMTECGPCPELKELYGMQEHPSPLYPPRTKQNVREADGTIWVGPHGDSRGFACTYNEVDRLQKPFLNIGFVLPESPKIIRSWCEAYNIKVLNVAGPRASRDSGAYRRTAELIIATFKE